MSETRAHLTSLTTDRGFMHMPALHDTSGRKVALAESSAADGPHVWLAIRSYGRDGDTHAHLGAEAAWALHEQLVWLLEHHYQGDARPAGPEGVSACPFIVTTDEATSYCSLAATAGPPQGSS